MLTGQRATSGEIATKRLSARRLGRVRKSSYGNGRSFALKPVEIVDIIPSSIGLPVAAEAASIDRLVEGIEQTR